jgi:hypothetical protein
MNIHNIYILDIYEFNINNIKFLNYIKRNKEIIKNMGIQLKVHIVYPSQLQNDYDIKLFFLSKQIDTFPVLITDKKIYTSLHEIVKVYESNIIAYKKYIESKNIYKESKDIKNNNKTIDQEINDEEHIHSYISQNLQMKTTNDDDDDELPFDDNNSSNMMDMYRHMISKRNTEKKNPNTNSKIRTLETTTNEQNDTNINNIIYKQLQQNKEDNISNTKEEDQDDNINIDPSIIEHDGDEDPQDILLEKAYWNRISETK